MSQTSTQSFARSSHAVWTSETHFKTRNSHGSHLRLLGITELGACSLLSRHAVTEYCAVLSTDDSNFFLLPSILCRSYIISLTQYTVQPFKTDMRHLTTGILSKKCVVRRFRRCANVTECTYTNLDCIAYYTLRLYGIVYCSRLKTCTSCYCTEYCWQL